MTDHGAKRTPNTGGLDRLKLVYFRRLNDVHLGTQLTLKALAGLDETLQSPRKKSLYHHFEVPSGGAPVARIRRDAKQMSKLMDKLIAHDERAKALLFCVSITEDYIYNVLRAVLRAYPDRLTHGTRGGPSEASVAFEELLLKGRDEIVEERIRLRLHRVLHAKPADYLQYLATILRVQVDLGTVEIFCEAKATRDVLVHADGRANSIYVEKAGSRARAQVDEHLEITQSYFDETIGTMKRLIGEINDGVAENYGQDQAVLAAATRFFL